MRLLSVGLTAIGGGFICAPAAAQSSSSDEANRSFVRIGVSHANLTEEVEVTIAGAPVADAGVQIDGATSVHAEFGYFLTEEVSVSLSLSGPFESDNVAAGSLAGSGNIATDRYGLFSLGGQWHLNRGGVFSPYLGGGLAYFHVFDVEDGIAVNAEVDNSFGAMLQAGVEARIAENKTVYVDLRRMFLETDSRGTLTGLPLSAASRLDPLVLSAGISFEF